MISELSSYPGYFQEPHWQSMGLLEISCVTLTGMLLVYWLLDMMCRSNGSLLGTPEALHRVGTLLVKCPSNWVLYFLIIPTSMGSKRCICNDFGNQRYLIGVIDTGCICGVMRLPPGDYCNGWLGMGEDKILGGGSIQMGLHGDKLLRHGACVWSIRLP